ncbi:hypothetical protein DSO57_1019609 [Entomophthora muscae]|uniref:Uncharacterized protein n=1 Tax=Entomophthora muscae TaxID=34485 RepID=A0ACC2U3C9_9FUNG|nr:hypothetical protein DSO57_1019609 [Entomophthora muscae]
MTSSLLWSRPPHVTKNEFIAALTAFKRKSELINDNWNLEGGGIQAPYITKKDVLHNLASQDPEVKIIHCLD